MDIRNIETFLKVVDRKNFTRAAADLNYVQSTVTMQIKQLEKELGYPLFDRLGKKVSLTALGERFLPLAEKLVQTQSQALSLNRSPEEIRGVLRIGLSEALVRETLAPLLPVYERTYPQVNLVVATGRQSDLLAWLKEGRLDMLCLTGQRCADPELLCCCERRERLVFVAGPRHPLVGAGPLSLRDCLAYPYIGPEDGYLGCQALAAAGGLSLRHSALLDNIQTVADTLGSNAFFSFLPERAVQRRLRTGRLAELPVAVPPQFCFSQLLYYRKKWVPPFMAGLIELIRQGMAPEAATT